MKSFAVELILCLLGLCACSVVADQDASDHSWHLPQTLSAIGIQTASDIDSVLLKLRYGETYEISYKDTPMLVNQLYNAMKDLGPLDGPNPHEDYNLLVFNVKSGNTYTIPLGVMENDENSDKPFVYGCACKRSDAFSAAIDEIRMSTKAANLNAQIGRFDASDIKLMLPHKIEITIPTESKEGKALLAKAKAIIDKFDFREIDPAEVSWEELLDKAKPKFGCLTIVPLNIISMDFYTIPKIYNPAPVVSHNCDGGFYDTVKREQNQCRAISIMDFGNYDPPVVIFICTNKSYIFSNSSRRKWELQRGEIYGVPVHSKNDKEYYKAPKQLYKELLNLEKKAYDLHSRF